MVAIAPSHVPLCAPAPQCCGWCSDTPRRIACFRCLKSGRAEVTFDLPRTRTYAHRRVWFQQLHPSLVALPAGYFCGYMVAWLGKGAKSAPRESKYRVREFAAQGGRAFVVAKVGGDTHHVYLRESGGGTCDCKGSSYESSAKANRRAWERHEAMSDTAGCTHLDAMLALLRGGWL